MTKIKCEHCGCDLYPLQVTNNEGVRRTDLICPQCGGGVVDVGNVKGKTLIDLGYDLQNKCVTCFSEIDEIDVSTKDDPERKTILYCAKCHETWDCGYVEKVGDNIPEPKQKWNDCPRCNGVDSLCGKCYQDSLKMERCKHGTSIKIIECHKCHEEMRLRRPLHYAELVDKLASVTLERENLKEQLQHSKGINESLQILAVEVEKERDAFRGIARDYFKSYAGLKRRAEEVREERDDLRERADFYKKERDESRKQLQTPAITKDDYELMVKTFSNQIEELKAERDAQAAAAEDFIRSEREAYAEARRDYIKALDTAAAGMRDLTARNNELQSRLDRLNNPLHRGAWD